MKTFNDISSTYIRDISRIPTMTATEEVEVAKKCKKGDAKAREQLITANLRFVISVARNYQNQGLQLDDLINVGNLGLIKAAARFEPNKNFKFISYAVWWIRQAILQELANHSRIVQYPLNKIALIHNVGKTKDKLKQKFHRDPSKEEIANVLNISIDDVDIAISAGLTPVYLDKPLETSHLLDVVNFEDGNQDQDKDIEQIMINRSSSVWVEKLLHILSNREQQIVKMYYGLGYDDQSTLEEIGIKLHITRERVRQLKDHALNALRRYSRTQLIKENV